MFLALCYSIFLISLFIVGFFLKLNSFFYLILILTFIQMFYFQIGKLKIKDSIKCLSIFKSNNVVGLLVMISLISGKI